jgi:hypothetical protein
MHNCVGGYTERVSQGRCIIMGVFKGDEMKVCVEITTNLGPSRKLSIHQYYGPCNNNISDDTLLDSKSVFTYKNRKEFTIGEQALAMQDRPAILQV